MSDLGKREKPNNEMVRKKSFNKKKWREQKYSNRAKVEKWDKIRKRQTLRQYNKELKKSGINFKLNSTNNEFNKNNSNNKFKQAQLKFQEIQQQKEKRRKEKQRIHKERTEALKAYKEKKLMKNKKLSQKTKKGQPLMKGRIELLLEKIQKDYAKSNT